MTAVSAFMYMVQWFSKETARKFRLFSRSLRRGASSVASLTSSANCTSMITIITFMLALASAWVWIGQLSFYELEQMYCSVDASSSIQNGDFRENTLQYFKCIPFILLFMMSTFIFKWKKIRFWDHDDNYFLNCFVLPPPPTPSLSYGILFLLLLIGVAAEQFCCFGRMFRILLGPPANV